jgi:agmatinase
VPVSPFDNALAVDQIEVAYSSLLARTPASVKEGSARSDRPVLSKDGLIHPRVVRYAWYL